MSEATNSTNGRGLALAGLILSSISAFGVHRVIFRLMNAYSDQSGAAAKTGPSPELAHSLRMELAEWLLPGLVALVLISLALWMKKNREGWFFVCSLGLALIWLPNFFPFGLYLVLIFLMKWKAFFPPPQRASSGA